MSSDRVERNGEGDDSLTLVSGLKAQTCLF